MAKVIHRLPLFYPISSWCVNRFCARQHQKLFEDPLDLIRPAHGHFFAIHT